MVFGDYQLEWVVKGDINDVYDLKFLGGVVLLVIRGGNDIQMNLVERI